MKKLFLILSLFLLIIPNFSQAGKNKIPISNFEIVSFRGEWQYGTLSVIGEIKNIGNIPGGPKVEVIARDDQGILVDSVKFWPNSTDNIMPGSSCGIKHPITDNTSAKKISIKVISASSWD